MIHFVKMIIECPKCGFTQPKDRYCANCGVDIENYLAKPTPLGAKILNSPFLYIGVFFIAIISLTIFIATQPDSQLVKTAKSWVLLSENDAGPEAEEVLTDERNESTLEEAQAPTATEEVRAESATFIAEKAAEKPTPAVKKIENLNIDFAELPRVNMEALYSQGQLLAETNEMQVLIFNKGSGLQALSETLSALEKLPGGKSSKINDNPNQAFNFFYTGASGDDYGMSFQVTLTTVNSQNASIEYELFLNLQGDDKLPGHNNSLSGSYQFPTPSTLVLTGILPRQKLSDEAQHEFSNTPLKIMNSEEFSDPDAHSPSEFLILISVN